MSENEERIDRDTYFLTLARTVALRATCLRRKYGAIIVKNNRIFSTGYCGAPRGEPNCCDIGICKREEMGFPQGEGYDYCIGVHAEENAIVMCAPEYMEGATIYISGFTAKSRCLVPSHPCKRCMRLIKNALLKKVVYQIADGSYDIITIN